MKNNHINEIDWYGRNFELITVLSILMVVNSTKVIDHKDLIVNRKLQMKFG